VTVEQTSSALPRGASARVSAQAWITSGVGQATLAFALYAALAIVYFGLKVIPDIGHECVCTNGQDPDVQMWFLVWWQHALLHGQNPFFTSSLFAPNHINLGALTLAPGAAIAALPLTIVFGPIVTYNVLALASPILAAFFAFLLCRYVSRSFAAGLIGGYVFGFSSYMLGHMLGHLTLVLTFPIPAAVLLTLKLINDVISRRRFIVLMALSLGALFLFSTELAFTFVLIGAITLALAVELMPRIRARITWATRDIVAAGAVAVLFTSPFVYYALTGKVLQGFFAHFGDTFVADATGFVVPTPITRLGRAWFEHVAGAFSGNLAENGVYVGLPLVLIVGRYAIMRWSVASTRLMMATLAVLVVLMLGAHLHIAGYPTVPLPWRALGHLPLLNQMAPVRLGVYAFLIVAIVLALWLSQNRSPRIRAVKWVAALLAVLLLVPNVGSGLWRMRENNVSFFAGGQYRRFLAPGDTVLALPWAQYGASMLWQAETEMRIRLAGGYLGALLPANYEREPILAAFWNPQLAPKPADLEGFLMRHDVEAVEVDGANRQQWPGSLAAIGLRPIALGGVLVYMVPPRLDPS